MPDSRTVKIFKNSSIAIIYQSLLIISKFVVRTIFIHTLGAEYLGVSGLFTNILSVLNLAELGIGISIVYSLYKPLSEKDTKEIKKYFKAFRYIYAFIGGIILLAGMCLIPFLDKIIIDSPNVGNIKLIYLLYLIDSSSSYFYAHYRSLISADQKGYMDHLNQIITLIIQTVAHILVLLMLKSFYLYLAINIFVHWISGFYLSLRIKKIYPYLREKTNEKLSGYQIRELIKNSLAIFSHKIGYTVLNSTDNILISMFVGTVIIGYYSNYHLIIITFTGMMALIVSALQAAVGNVCSVDNLVKQHDIFQKINFMFFWIYGVFLTGLIFIATPFIKIWLGEEYIMQESVLLVVYINAFLQGVRQVVAIYTTATGLFYKMRYKPIFEVIINLVVSVVLVKKMGVIGVFIGTLVSFILTNLWYEPYILYKYHFNRNSMIYFKNCVKYSAIITMSIFINGLIYSYVKLAGIAELVIKCITCIVIPSFLFIVFFGKTVEYIYAKDIMLGLLVKIKRALFKMGKGENDV